MKSNMNKKIAAMGIAGLTGFAFVNSALGSNVLGVNAKTTETVIVTERKDKLKPASGSAIDNKDKIKPASGSAINGKDKIKPASGPAIDGKDKGKPASGSAIDDKDKGKPASGSAIDDKDKGKPDSSNNGKDKGKPASGSAIDNKDKGKPTTDTPSKSPEKHNNTKKVKIKKTKKTAKNKIKITLSGTNTWSNAQVIIKTSEGKNVKAKITKKTSTYCVIQTNKKLEKKTYIIKLKGIKVKGSSKYETITTKINVK